MIFQAKKIKNDDEGLPSRSKPLYSCPAYAFCSGECSRPCPRLSVRETKLAMSKVNIDGDVRSCGSMGFLSIVS
jgi:hypothetical protein